MWSGANFLHDIHQPTVTSYDYDAPVGEAGQLTEKFERYREVLRKYATEPLPEPPPAPRRLTPQQVDVLGWADLADRLDHFGAPVADPAPLTMEALGQDHGLVLYRTEVTLRDDPSSSPSTVCATGLSSSSTESRWPCSAATIRTTR